MLDVASSLSEEEQLEVGVSNISLSDLSQHLSEEQEEPQVEETMAAIEVQPKLDEEEEIVNDQEDPEVVEAVAPPQPPTKDLFSLFSLAFICKSKDLSERKIRLEFGLVAEVSSSKQNCKAVKTIQSSGVSCKRTTRQGRCNCDC